jgi:hypothetical protein
MMMRGGRALSDAAVSDVLGVIFGDVQYKSAHAYAAGRHEWKRYMDVPDDEIHAQAYRRVVDGVEQPEPPPRGLVSWFYTNPDAEATEMYAHYQEFETGMTAAWEEASDLIRGIGGEPAEFVFGDPVFAVEPEEGNPYDAQVERQRQKTCVTTCRAACVASCNKPVAT